MAIRIGCQQRLEFGKFHGMAIVWGDGIDDEAEEFGTINS
jgi:hypothetical protein